MSHSRAQKGFSLVEIVVTVGIVAVVALIIASFQRNIFFYNSVNQDNLNAQTDGRRAERMFVSDMRQAAPSALGAYPIVQASSTSITFYADADNDGVEEQVRYFLSGTSLRRGVVVPTGSPLTYNQANEKLITLISNVTNSTSPALFEYFDSNYDGMTSPLAAPVSVISIRLVKLQAIIDKSATRPPAALTITTQVTLRNLKDNL